MLKLFEMLTLFDWFTPLAKSAEAWTKDPLGRAGKCVIDHGALIEMGWNQNNIKTLMRSHGIFIFGEQYAYPQDEFGFYIPANKFTEANWLLSHNNIPVKRIAR